MDVSMRVAITVINLKVSRLNNFYIKFHPNHIIFFIRIYPL